MQKGLQANIMSRPRCQGVVSSAVQPAPGFLSPPPSLREREMGLQHVPKGMTTCPPPPHTWTWAFQGLLPAVGTGSTTPPPTTLLQGATIFRQAELISHWQIARLWRQLHHHLATVGTSSLCLNMQRVQTQTRYQVQMGEATFRFLGMTKILFNCICLCVFVFSALTSVTFNFTLPPPPPLIVHICIFLVHCYQTIPITHIDS